MYIKQSVRETSTNWALRTYQLFYNLFFSAIVWLINQLRIFSLMSVNVNSRFNWFPYTIFSLMSFYVFYRRLLDNFSKRWYMYLFSVLVRYMTERVTHATEVKIISWRPWTVFGQTQYSDSISGSSPLAQCKHLSPILTDWIGNYILWWLSKCKEDM